MISRPIMRVVSLVLMTLALSVSLHAAARVLKSNVIELTQLPKLRPEFPVPNEPNMLFYIQRSVNSNTVIYAANLDQQGHPVADDPVQVYWRWYNVDGHRKPLNFIERTMAYGVSLQGRDNQAKSVAFQVAALPERKLLLEESNKGVPQAVIQIGNRPARLVYVYLQVDDRGLMPSVTAIDLFGVDKLSGKVLHEHVVRD